MTVALRIAITGLLLVSLFSIAAPTEAQDIPTLLGTAQTATQQMVNQIRAALAATDVATARNLAQQAVAGGQQAIAALQQVLTLSPDDATRSRAEALITHLQAAVNSAQLAISGPDATLRNSLDAARGEAEEALAEFPPIGAPGQLPSAGDTLPAQTIALVGSLGAALLFIGSWLRRSAVAA